jgi:hypothetical protein
VWYVALSWGMTFCQKPSKDLKKDASIDIGNGTMFRNNIELSFGIMSKMD